MIYEKAMELVAEMRSGRHTQGIGKLCDRNSAKCCLGVASNMVYPAVFSTKDGLYKYDGESTYLSPNVVRVFGFHNNMGARSDGQGVFIDGRKFLSISHANDSGIDFPMIADYIEANWQYL